MSAIPALDLRPDRKPEGPPSNIEAEQALLGAILYDNEAYHRIDGVQASHFHEPFHGRLFDGICSKVAKGMLAEPVLLADHFKADPAFAEMGGLSYLADLVDRAPPAVTARDYAAEIIDLAQRRDLIEACHETAIAADGDRELSARDHVEGIEQRLYALTDAKGSGTGFQTFGKALTGAINMASEAYSRDGGLAGVSTGLIDLDKKLGGLHPSDLLILAGRPSIGKTALATNIAFHVARNYAWQLQPDGTRKTVNGGIVGFFSLEMSAEQLALRILAEASGVSSDRLRKGEVNASEFGQVRDAALELNEIPLHIDATGGLSLAKLTARARRLKRTSGLDLIVVDYLQLITTDMRSREANRVQEVSQITVGLKALAKELNVPIVALSQLSRQVESREDKRPQLSDLRESGSIEQDSDVVMFVYREAYYLSRAEPREGTAEHLAWADDMARCAHQADVIIGKQRHGPIGSIKLGFNADTTKFSSLAQEGRFEPRHVRLPYGGD